MYTFSIAGEGVTDQAVIENILCGYFENLNLEDEINYSHPLYDETDQKQRGFSNWTLLLDYLAHSDFRADVLNCEFIVIQVDTDISNEKGFDVSQFDPDNQPLTPEILITHVVDKLIGTIEGGETGFYQEHAERIIFAVSVHSIECWLYAHYNKEPPLKSPKITGCAKALSYYLLNKDKNKAFSKIEKTQPCYNKLSQPFQKRQHIDAVAQKDPSFRVFIQSLEKIENQIFNLNNSG